MFLKNGKVRMKHVLVGLMLAAGSFASAQINLSTTDRSNLSDVITQIRSGSDYKFFYEDALTTTKVHAVKLSNASIEKALDSVLRGTNITYVIKGKHIYLKKNAAPAAPATTRQTTTPAGPETQSYRPRCR